VRFYGNTGPELSLVKDLGLCARPCDVVCTLVVSASDITPLACHMSEIKVSTPNAPSIQPFTYDTAHLFLQHEFAFPCRIRDVISCGIANVGLVEQLRASTVRGCMQLYALEASLLSACFLLQHSSGVNAVTRDRA
jgi:hypothetical protein